MAEKLNENGGLENSNGVFRVEFEGPGAARWAVEGSYLGIRGAGDLEQARRDALVVMRDVLAAGLS